ncbi:MAG: GNAT family N-acetyltransferase [Flavobacteriaceae bacterium]|jgi:GNAT superfamily N-acetyltransferase|nr:GNAT family N-acetyltransferase [Flavobacteriaceae bacterium]
MIEIKSLKDISLLEILNTFNASFSDYLIPMNLSENEFKTKLYTENINWDFSVGVFFDQNLVAFILHFDDFEKGKKVLYNGGTGVVPSQRGNRWTQKMYEYLYPILRENQIQEVILEVIATNEKAIGAYQKIGFKTERIVKCYKGILPHDLQINQALNLVEMEKPDWELFQSFWDIQPTWQNLPSVVDRMENKKILGAFLDNQLVGYLIFDPGKKRGHQMAVKLSHRRKYVAETLLSQMNEMGKEYSLLNVDEDALGLVSLLEKMKWTNTVNQLEMRLKLP